MQLRIEHRLQTGKILGRIIKKINQGILGLLFFHSMLKILSFLLRYTSTTSSSSPTTLGSGHSGILLIEEARICSQGTILCLLFGVFPRCPLGLTTTRTLPREEEEDAELLLLLLLLLL